MLYGPVAASRRFRKRVMAGAADYLAIADFVNGGYSVGGTSLTADDVVNDTDRISGSGLSILPGSGNAVSYLGAFRDLLFTGNWTVLFEVDLLAPETSPPTHDNWLLFMWAGGFELGIVTNQGWLQAYEEGASDSRAAFAEDAAVVGLNRFAVTRTDATIAHSVNGAAPEVDDTPMAAEEWTSANGSYHNRSSPAGHIRSITVYPPQSTNDLPALSAI